MTASHVSPEPATHMVVEALEQRFGDFGMRYKPVIDIESVWGEGVGSLCFISLLDTALVLYEALTFADLGVEPWEFDYDTAL